MNMYFRPKIQNGPVAKRGRAGFSTPVNPRLPKLSFSGTPSPLWDTISLSELTHRSLAKLGLDEPLQSTQIVAKEQAASRSRLLLGLIGCGVLLAGGFMFSLRDHFTAYAVGREGVKLKAKIEHAEAEQQRLAVELNRAGSPLSLEQAAREAGLEPLTMERKKVAGAPRKIATAEKAKTQQRVNQPTRKTVSKRKTAEH